MKSLQDLIYIRKRKCILLELFTIEKKKKKIEEGYLMTT